MRPRLQGQIGSNNKERMSVFELRPILQQLVPTYCFLSASNLERVDGYNLSLMTLCDVLHTLREAGAQKNRKGPPRGPHICRVRREKGFD